MVKEHRYIFDAEDISSLVYACHHCKNEVVVRVNGEGKPGKKCSSCGESIMEPAFDSIDPNITILLNLRTLLMARATSKVQLRFVVPDPNAEEET